MTSTTLIIFIACLSKVLMESLYLQNCCWHFPLLSLTSSFVSMPLLFRDAQPVFPFVASMFLTHSLMYPMIVSCILTPRTTSAVEAMSVVKFCPELFDVLPPSGVFSLFCFQFFPSGLHLVGFYYYYY